MITTLLSTAGKLAGSVFGGYQASKAMRRVRAMLKEQQRDNQNWYDRRMNQDFGQTAEAQDAMRRTREYAEELSRKADGTRAVSGGTEESGIAAKAQAAKMVGDTAATIAAGGTQAKDAIEQQYLANRQTLKSTETELEKEKAREIAKALLSF